MPLVVRSVRNTERVYKNETALQVQALEAEFPGDFSKIHHLVRGDNYKRSFLETGAQRARPGARRPSRLHACGQGGAMLRNATRGLDKI
eukprot:2359412-Prymnesium_polylepis.2